MAAAGQSGPGRGKTSKLGVYDTEESESAPNPEYSTDEGAEPGKAKPTRGGSGGKGRCQGEQGRILHGSDSERNVRVTEVGSCASAGPGNPGSGRRHIQGKSRYAVVPLVRICAGGGQR